MGVEEKEGRPRTTAEKTKRKPAKKKTTTKTPPKKTPGGSGSNPYGTKNSRYAKGYHTGEDLPGKTGDPVNAVQDGTIRVRNTGSKGYGLHVVLVAADGTEYIYGHLSSVGVKNGQKVKAGQVIGKIGNTGMSDGSHLHFEIRKNGADVDPRGFLALASPIGGNASNYAAASTYQFPASGKAGSGSMSSSGQLPPNATDAQVIDYIKNTFGGEMSSWLEIPEIRNLLIKGVRGGMTAERIAVEVKNTKWWKARNTQMRDWETVDPVTKRTRIQARAADMAAYWNSITGGNWDIEQFLGDAEQVERGGVPFEVWKFRTDRKAEAIPGTPAHKRKATEVADPKIAIENMTGQLEDMARNSYLVPLSRADATKWATAISNKSQTEGGNYVSEQDYIDWLRTQAAGLFPAFADAINRGVDPATLMGPYRQMASEEMERIIDWTDPILTEILHAPAGKEGGPLGLSQYRQMLRNRPEWSRTTRANDLASDHALRLLQELGRVK